MSIIPTFLPHPTSGWRAQNVLFATMVEGGWPFLGGQLPLAFFQPPVQSLSSRFVHFTLPGNLTSSTTVNRNSRCQEPRQPAALLGVTSDYIGSSTVPLWLPPALDWESCAVPWSGTPRAQGMAADMQERCTSYIGLRGHQELAPGTKGC